ncbi:E3 ubiquitin-protein ligase NHLRC1 [Pyrgilauda ruficollis]|uniref:E3 ubiquitin-protein ligase NHLRC1 n=1 Tax=Pyrgilauda ruficollis TaxID=221976 RepID=UPI001B85ECAF|nr:E3 ubiquitin-protein ligase NHLRC1 [Pyrgilauda ruficollis]
MSVRIWWVCEYSGGWLNILEDTWMCWWMYAHGWTCGCRGGRGDIPRSRREGRPGPCSAPAGPQGARARLGRAQRPPRWARGIRGRCGGSDRSPQAGMAAEDEAELSLLECRVCFEPYGPDGQRRPLNLPCGHVLCRGCVGALAGAERQRLECPFCRRLCGPAETSDCRPLLQLLELLGPAGGGLASALGRSGGGAAAAPAGLGLRLCLGGWGSLVNPTGVAACPGSGRLAVAHDGKKRIHVFGPSGFCLRRFGERGDASNDIKYPLDVTVTSDGHVVVTDGGDCSVKAFDFEGRGVLAVREGFCLPWGLDATPKSEVILTDSEAGALYRLTADFQRGELKKCQMIRSRLVSPRAVAVCQTSGAVVVIEHLKARGASRGSTRVTIFSAEMDLIGQMDSFGLNLVFPSRIYATAVAFDKEGRVIVTDVCSQAVICLGKPEEFPIFNPLISNGLSYPVGLTYTANNSLVVLDSGDHSVKVYSSA